MSESKAEYYAKHLEALVEPEVQPTGLPTLLAQMVNEYHGALKLNGYSGFPDRLVEGFSQMLLACAQPAITAYLEQLTTPPKFVAKPTPTDYIKAEQAMEMARAGYPDLARKHLGLDEPDTDRQLAYREFCARLALASPDAPAPSFEEWEAARKRVGLE